VRGWFGFAVQEKREAWGGLRNRRPPAYRFVLAYQEVESTAFSRFMTSEATALMYHQLFIEGRLAVIEVFE